MSYRLKAALCGVLATISSGYGYAALDEVAQAVSNGDYGTALQVLESSPEGQRQSVEGQLLQAAALAGSGKLEVAEAKYKALIAQAPELPEAYNNLAALYARQGKLDEARKLLEQAMRTNPSYATVYDNLSNIYLEMSRSSYAKALQIRQRNGGPRLQPIYSVNAVQPTPVSPVVVARADISDNEASEPAPVSEKVAAPAVPEPGAEAEVDATTSDKTTTEQEDTPESDVAVAGMAERVRETPPAGDVAVPENPEAVAETPGEGAVAREQEPVPEQPPAVAVMSEPAAGNSVSEAEPRPEPATPMKPDTAQAREDVVAMLKRWAAAWAGQNVEGYLNAYDQGFQPGHGLSLAQWQAQRRKRLSKPAYIEVQLGDFEVKLQGDNRAVVDLVQHYSSDRYSDLTRKRLRLIRQSDGWKIVSEKTIEVL